MGEENQGEILLDKSGTGRVRPWKDKKMSNMLLSEAYEEINIKKAWRLEDCATWLEFSVTDGNNKRLTGANFCRVRLCPMCSWRRGLKIFSHTKKIMDEMNKEKDWAYIFLTFTVENCKDIDLKNSIDEMMSGWNRLMGYSKVSGVVEGWYRGLELTHNLDYKSEFYDTYHPHFHCVFAVDKSYFKKTDKYISQSEWTSLFKKAMRLDYTPIVDVRRVKGNTAAAVSEIAKYAVKDSDYIIPNDWDLTVETVKFLDEVLAYRRLVAYGGKFKEYHKKLNLDDEIDGDLINIEDENEEIEGKIEKVIYSWNVGYNQYIKD